MRLSLLLSLSLSLSLSAGCSGPSPIDDTGIADAGADAGSAPVDAATVDAFVVPRPRALPLSCATASGSPVDVVPFARIDADGTRRTAGVLREDDDGPQTLRDDDPASGWAPASGALATLRIDLGPGVERPLALDTIAITTGGPAPTDVHAYVLEACGGGVVADFAWADPTTPLSLAGTCGTCVELDLRGGASTRVLSVALATRDPGISLPSLLPDPPPAPPTPMHLESGVIEGFYGPPWSFSERARAIDAMSILGMGTYLYAPKNDPLHRSAWRTPYDAATVARFGDLASLAHARGVRFLFGVSPFLDYDASVPAHEAALVAKLRTLLDAGVDGIAILADDLLSGAEPTDGALGAMHAGVVVRVVAQLQMSHPGTITWFVPTIYHDALLASTPGGAAYLMALRNLPPEVRVLWTGTNVGSATLVGADLTTVRGLIGRDPIVWENEWANDVAGTVRAHLFLGTYEGRDAALRTATHGIAANPLVQGSISRMPMAMLGAWLSRDETGDAAREAAATLEARYLWRPWPEAHTTLVRAMEAYDGTFTESETHRRLEAALARITASAATGAPAADDVAIALDVFAGMATLGSLVHHGTFDVELGDELAPPLASLSEHGRAGLALLDALTARVGGADGTAAEADARAHHEAARRASRFVWAATTVTDALDAIVAAPATDRGLRAPPTTTSTIPPCVAGAAIDLAPFAAGEIRAYGLPGATVTGTRVSFTAPHPGRLVGVVTARDPSGGVASRVIDLVCIPAR